MDPDNNPLSRVERTLWTVWSYITGAVNRFLRPQPTTTVSNDPNSFQDSAVDSEPPDCGHAEGATRGVDEEQPLATGSLLSSSRPVVAWDLCTRDINLRPDEESVQCETQLSEDSEGQETEDGEGTKEEELGQTGSDDEELLVAKDARAKEDEEKTEIATCGQDETPENDERNVTVSSRHLTDDAVSEDMEESGRIAGAEEETARTVTPDDHQQVDETTAKIQVKEDKMRREDEQDVEPEGIEVKLHTKTDLSPEEEDNRRKGEVAVPGAVTVVTQEDAESGEGVLQLASANENKSDEGTKPVQSQLSVWEELSDVSEDELNVVGQERVMVHRSESDEAEEEEEDERERGASAEEENTNEATNNQTRDDESILAECVACHEEAAQSADTWLHSAEFTDKEQEDVVVTEVPTTTSEADVTIAAEEIFEERLPREVDNKESYMERVCATTSVTVKPEGETGQEVSREFGSIPLGIGEGQFVVSQELNTPTCEETQEGVPEYNNELGPDEKSTQRFLEVGDCEEIQTTQLPEEVESKESLQNSGCGAGADYSLAREPMEEKQESAEGIKNSFDLLVEEHTGILQLTDTGLPQETEKPLAEAGFQESGHLFEEEEGKLLDSLMRTEDGHLEKEFKSHVGSADESEKTAERLQDGTEELLVELYDSKDAAGDSRETRGAVAAEEEGFAEEPLKLLEADVQKMTETSFFQELVHAMHTEQSSSRTPSLLEDITECGSLKHSVELDPKSLDGSPLEMHDAGIDMEERDCGDEEEEAEDETQLQVAGMPAEVITDWEETCDNRTAESELSLHFKTQETERQSPDTALESEREMITDTEAAVELKAPESVGETAVHVPESERSSSISGHLDVIDEEILDLWIETAMSEDTDGIKKRDTPEPGQQMDADIDPLNEEQISPEKENEPLIESNSAESGLVSDTEMSSSTAESGFLDQSLSEWGAQNGETQLLKSTSTCSLQDIHDMLASMSDSVDVSEWSAHQLDSESLDIPMEETAETVQSYLKEEESVTETRSYPESGVTSPETRHPESGEKPDEEGVKSAGTETGSHRELDVEVTDQAVNTDWEDTEEADVTSPTNMSAEDEHLETTVSDSSDDIKPTESARSRSGSEASLEEGVVWTEPASQGDTWTESERNLLKSSSLDEPQPGWSDDGAKTLPELNEAEVTEEPTITSEDQTEVDSPVLDFAVQRSRIAVKNPRVRPPKNPRSLLHKPSVDPTPSSHVPVKLPVGVPLRGLGIGIKLPGLGAGFPVLKKTQRVVKDDHSQGTLAQEPEGKSEDKSDAPKQDEAPHKPKRMPPGHPGFGNPLMSELKTKLKKTAKE